MFWDVVEGIGPLVVVFGAIVAVVWLRGRVNQVRLAKQAETQQQLLAKFQSGEELAEFIETEGGREYLRQFESNPHGTILAVLGTGIVTSVLGLGLLVLVIWQGYLLFPGVVTMALGIGLVLAAFISRRLSDKGAGTKSGDPEP